MFSEIPKYYHTIRYLKPGQIIGRVFAILKKNILTETYPDAPENLSGSLHNSVGFLFHEPWNSRHEILNGRFTFLQKTIQFKNGIDWLPEEMPLLWCFNLHYFNYLHLLKQNEQLEICKDWIKKNNRVGKTTAWHPYPLSLRIINWCKADLHDTEVDKSIYLQASFLFRHQETYHPANHLLENARALMFAGIYFGNKGEAPKWLLAGQEIFKRELPIQVLSDGGYFERSTMYHAIIFEGILDIINISHEEMSARKIFLDCADKMSIFLEALTHPDGEISLFNDSTTEIAPKTTQLISYYKKLTGNRIPKKYIFKECGYYIHSDEDFYLMIDGGPIGPDYIPAHAHADIFSFELSVKGKQLIVDSGVFEYTSGDMREYSRSTRAHNTVVIDNLSQADCWGSFRVARRFPPFNVHFFSDTASSFFEGLFDGYTFLLGDNIVHQRKILISRAKKFIIIHDYISGSGNHITESILHFHPDAELTICDNSVNVSRTEVSINIGIEQGEFHIEDSYYSPRFGDKQLNKALVISQYSIPALIRYKISLNEPHKYKNIQ